MKSFFQKLNANKSKKLAIALAVALSATAFAGCGSSQTPSKSSASSSTQQTQQANLDNLSDARNTPTVRAAAAVGPSVVGITNKAVARDFFNNPVESQGVGSGVIDPPRLLAGQTYAGDVFPVDHGERNVFQLLQGPQMAFQMGETCLAYHIAHSQNGIEHGVPPNI